MSCTKTRGDRSNRSAVICTVASILLKFRYPEMSLVHKIITCILYTGHCSKQVQYTCSFSYERMPERPLS